MEKDHGVIRSTVWKSSFFSQSNATSVFIDSMAWHGMVQHSGGVRVVFRSLRQKGQWSERALTASNRTNRIIFICQFNAPAVTSDLSVHVHRSISIYATR